MFLGLGDWVRAFVGVGTKGKWARIKRVRKPFKLFAWKIWSHKTRGLSNIHVPTRTPNYIQLQKYAKYAKGMSWGSGVERPKRFSLVVCWVIDYSELFDGSRFICKVSSWPAQISKTFSLARLWLPTQEKNMQCCSNSEFLDLSLAGGKSNMFG